MQTTISSGVQLKNQQSELKSEADLTVRPLVRKVYVCACFLLVPFFMGNIWDVSRAGLSMCSELALGCNVVNIMCNSLLYLGLLLHHSFHLT